jgi:hypothetical protein
LQPIAKQSNGGGYELKWEAGEDQNIRRDIMQQAVLVLQNVMCRLTSPSCANSDQRPYETFVHGYPNIITGTRASKAS